MNWLRPGLLLAVFSITILGGCGTNGVPSWKPLPTQSPSGTPTPLPQFTVSGWILDAGTNGGKGDAIAGADVRLFTAGIELKNARAQTKTLQDGTFVLSVPAGRYVLEITPPAYLKNAYPLYHTEVEINGSSVALSPIRVNLLTQDEQEWIAQTNADRARFGASSTVVADEAAMLAAKAWADYLSAHPDATHFGPAGETPEQRYKSLGGIGRNGENVAKGTNDGPWQDAESGWLSESQYCPSPPSASCPLVIDGHETGHFVNIVSPDVIWIGVGENLHGTSLPPGGVWSMFDAEYVAYP